MDVAAERDLVGVAIADAHRNREEHRHGRRRPEDEVGALLVAELVELPPVDGEHARVHATSTGWRAAPRSWPSVRRKNSVSSDAACGVSSTGAAAASTSAADSAATASSLALK